MEPLATGQPHRGWGCPRILSDIPSPLNSRLSWRLSSQPRAKPRPLLVAHALGPDGWEPWRKSRGDHGGGWKGLEKLACSPDVIIHWLRRGGWIYGDPTGLGWTILRAEQGFLPEDLVIRMPDWREVGGGGLRGPCEGILGVGEEPGGHRVSLENSHSKVQGPGCETAGRIQMPGFGSLTLGKAVSHPLRDHRVWVLLGGHWDGL